MILQFKTSEGFWNIDKDALIWHRFDEKPTEGTAPAEHGTLTYMDKGVYALDSRREGLLTFSTIILEVKGVATVFLDPNVPAWDFTLPVPIKEIRYAVVPRWAQASAK